MRRRAAGRRRPGQSRTGRSGGAHTFTKGVRDTDAHRHSADRSSPRDAIPIGDSGHSGADSRALRTLGANRLRHARSETDFVCDRHGQAADSKSGRSSNGHINLDADIDATGDADFGTHGVGDGPTPDAVSHSQRDIDVDCDAVAHTDAFSHTHRAISHTNTASDADRHPDGDRHP